MWDANDGLDECGVRSVHDGCDVRSVCNVYSDLDELNGYAIRSVHGGISDCAVCDDLDTDISLMPNCPLISSSPWCPCLP